jgi:hypothetical protein
MGALGVFDPSILGHPQVPQIPGPFETYGKLLSLRGMMEQSKLRQVELQQHQMALEQAREQLQRRQNLSSFISSTPNLNLSDPATRMKILGIDPVTGQKFLEQHGEMEARAATTAKTQAELHANAQKAMARDVMGLAQIPVDEQEGYYTGKVNDWLSQGHITPQQAQMLINAGVPRKEWREALYRSAFGTDYDKILAERDQATAAALKRPVEQRKLEAEERKAEQDAIRAQQEVTGTAPITPYQQRQLDIQQQAQQRLGQPNTPADFARIATDPNATPEQRTQAEAALKRLTQQTLAGRPVVNVGGREGRTPDDPKLIADAIIEGKQSPELTGLYGVGPAVRAELQRRGYDHARALGDWRGTQYMMRTMNGQQQVRLRQAVDFTSHSLDQVDDLFNRWQATGKPTGFPILNKGSLALAKNLPGDAGAIATALEAQINDLVSELGTVYKGGNSATNEALKLAGENLKANWNAKQFKEQVANIRRNLQIRRNSIYSTTPYGVTEGSPYAPVTPAPETAPATAPTVKMRAPNGDVRDVPADQVEKFERLGAKRM